MRHMREERTTQGARNYYAVMTSNNGRAYRRQNDFGSSRIIANTYTVSWGIERIYYLDNGWVYLL